MNKKGGYIIIDLQSATIVNDLAKALDSNKPVLVYNDGVANFYTLSFADDVYTLTGAKDSYSVDADGVVTDTTKHIYSFEIRCNDSSENNIYLYGLLPSNISITNTDEFIDYIKNTFNSNTKALMVNGYNGDSAVVYCSLYYNTNNDEFDLIGSNDSDEAITITIVNLKQLF